jgi:GTP cyclohydrolase II
LTDLHGAIRGALLARGRRRIDTGFGRFDLSGFRNLETHRSCLALSRGDVSGRAPLLARVHSSCVTSEFFGACDCDCAAQLDGALEAIAAEGRGVLFYLEQEGRGAGLAAKARDRMLVQASRQRLTTFEAYERMGLRHDLRRYDEVAAMAALLGIEAPLVLLTNNPDKAEALEREKLAIARLQPIEHAASPFNVHYLSAKRRSGHALADASSTLDAELPEAVEALEPQALPGRPDLVRVARYLLPVLPGCDARALRGAVALPDPVWLRLHLYVDAELGGEIVVLETGAATAPSWLARVQPEPLLERLPLRATPARTAWSRVVEALAADGAGVVALSRRSARGACTASERGGAHLDLLAHHLAGRIVVPLRDAGEPDPSRALRDRGLAVAPSRSIARGR